MRPFPRPHHARAAGLLCAGVLALVAGVAPAGAVTKNRQDPPTPRATTTTTTAPATPADASSIVPSPDQRSSATAARTWDDEPS